MLHRGKGMRKRIAIWADQLDVDWETFAKGFTDLMEEDAAFAEMHSVELRSKVYALLPKIEEEQVGMIAYETKECPFCLKGGTVEVDEQEIKDYDENKNNDASRLRFVQNALVTASSSVREQVMSGIHPDCWDEFVGDETPMLEESEVTE